MKALLQRVAQAHVTINDQFEGRIGQGLLVLLCAEPNDNETIADRLLRKTMALRIFADDAGKMNRSLLDIGGELLIISQFTLCADTSSGNRPSFTAAAPPALAQTLYDYFVNQARLSGLNVQTGQFGADMQVGLVNDGPVTIPITMR
jgi:D-tyrosyl-tRNA(Tyr) deacylase